MRQQKWESVLFLDGAKEVGEAPGLQAGVAQRGKSAPFLHQTLRIVPGNKLRLAEAASALLTHSLSLLGLSKVKYSTMTVEGEKKRALICDIADDDAATVASTAKHAELSKIHRVPSGDLYFLKE